MGRRITILVGLMLVLLACATAGVAEAGSLDLGAAVQLALANNRDWQLTQTEVSLAEQRREYDDKNLPIVSGSGVALDYAAGDWRSPTVQFQGRMDLSDHSRLELTVPLRVVDGSVQVRPGISYTHDLFVPKQVERPVQPSSTAESILFSEQQQLILDVGRAYFQVLKAGHAHVIKEQELHLAELQAQRVRELERPDVEALRADQAVDDARAALQEAVEAEQTAQRQLLSLLDVDTWNQDPEQSVVFAAMERELSYWQDVGIPAHPQVLEGQYRLALAEANLADFAADHGYDVALSSSYQERTTAGQTDYELRAAITVRRTFYPVDPLRSSELELAVAKAQLGLENAWVRAERDIETAYRQVRVIEARIETLDQRLTDARHSLLQEELRYQAGLSTQLEVLQLQYLVNELAYDLLHAQYDHKMAVAQLHVASSLAIPW